MEEQNNTAFSLTAEELEFCISTLQIEIEEVERTIKDKNIAIDERIELKAYIKKLDSIQDQFLTEDNAFLSIDLLQVYHLVQQQRDYMNDILDKETMSLDMRREGQQNLRTANSIMRKLRNYFKKFEIDV
ncbi:MAG: hypothetical protein LUE11_07920 [Clostridia bacterium]|nr:hypothetical protein [Clostridia bacterium]